MTTIPTVTVTSYTGSSSTNGSVPTNPTQTASNPQQAQSSLLATTAAAAEAAIAPQNSPTQPYASLTTTPSSLVLSYPNDLPPYFMGFFIAAYQRPSIMSPVTLSSYKVIGLPVPANMTDAQHVVYNEQPLGTALGYIADHAASGLLAISNGYKNAIAQNQGALADTINSGATSLLGAAEATAASLSGTIGQVISQSYGNAPNPYLQVFFETPAYKRHEFSWRFSPNNPAESKKMKNIVDTFRYAQLPAKGAGDGAFLTYPNIIYPFYSPNAYQLYLFRACVIEDTMMQYAPNGVPAFMAGTQFSESIDFTLRLLEIELWIKDTFANAAYPGYVSV